MGLSGDIVRWYKEKARNGQRITSRGLRDELGIRSDYYGSSKVGHALKTLSKYGYFEYVGDEVTHTPTGMYVMRVWEVRK